MKKPTPEEKLLRDIFASDKAIPTTCHHCLMVVARPCKEPNNDCVLFRAAVTHPQRLRNVNVYDLEVARRKRMH